MIEFFVAWFLLLCGYLLGYFTGQAFKTPIFFKRIISDKPIENGDLTGRYVVEGLDGNIHYVFPPITVTLEE